jgi:DNA-binding transcriptional LysR family regulator
LQQIAGDIHWGWLDSILRQHDAVIDQHRVLYTEPVCFVARPDHPLASMPRLSWADLAVWRNAAPAAKKE